MRAEQKAKREGGAAKGGADSKPDEPNPNIKGEQMWVTSQYLDRHTCPSQRCGVVGGLFFRESAHVQERKNEWARISRRYDASCADGKSEYVDKGNARCTSANGIENGQFAEWVRLSSLSTKRPPDPADTATAAERLVKDSDDFTQHRRAFVRAAHQLIDEGRCTEADFLENGGWMKSTVERDAPVYFTYCGGMTLANKIQLNAATGRLY
jgi:hypothetical protein